MDICLERVTQEQREILARLLELYQYDFSEYDGGDVNPYGLYGYAYLDYYWTEKGRYAYFIKVDGKLAGFVMLCGYCYVSREKDVHFLSEFFVMKKYRRKGIGSTAFREILRLHPGKWELTVHPNNPGAETFWENAIGQYAASGYRVVRDVPGVYEDAMASAYLFEK